MNRKIELHDSEVAEVRVSEGMVTVRFAPAYVHESAGEPGVDAGTGWIQDAELLIFEATLVGKIPPLPCDLDDGKMVIDGHEMDNMIPLPLESAGNVRFVGAFKYDDFMIEVVGKGCRVVLGPDATYVEEFTPLG
jgi:hypothetical protein